MGPNEAPPLAASSQICDTWELADALNHRLHHALTVKGPAVHPDRDHHIRKGDIIISRRNDATVDVRAGPPPSAR